MRHARYCPLTHFQFLAATGKYDIARRLLYVPDLFLLRTLPDKKTVENFFHTIEKADPALAGFIRLYLLTGFFLFPEMRDSAHRDWLKKYASPERFFPQKDFDGLTSARWLPVPVGVVSADRSRLYYFICGFNPDARMPLLPSWAGHLLDGEALATINVAARAAEKLAKKSGRGLIVYPLLPDQGEVRITGSSLGLPLAVGFLSLLKGQSISPGLAMTGAITPDGDVNEVAELGAKIDLFQRQKFDAVLYPSANGFPLGKTRPGCYPVSDLNQAEAFCELHSPDNAEKLQLFWQMLGDAGTFVANADIAPPDWLDRARENNWAQKAIAGIVSQPDLLLGLAEKLTACADLHQLKQGQAISSFIDRKTLLKKGVAAPLAAFKWCAANFSLANHHGQVKTSRQWAESAESFLPQALAADINAVATFYNYYLVSQHNLYSFQPQLPGYLRAVIKCLEGQYQCRYRAGGRAFIVLGRLYGTLVQHYAFRGPSNIEKVEAYSKKARQALGEKTVPEFKNEWIRQYSYFAYALISAGRFKQAEKYLFKYLEVSGWDNLIVRLNCFSQWHHALLARFLAEAGRPDIRLKYLESRPFIEADKVRPEHPWQLWYWNMGRIALALNRTDLAGELMEESLSRCLASKDGPTINVMALMPLSFLHYYKRVEPSKLKDAEKQVRAAAKQLDQNHFRPLRDNKFSAVLEQVRQHPEILFPFTYR